MEMEVLEVKIGQWVGSTAHPVTVRTLYILVGNPYKPVIAIVTWGVDPR